MGKLTIDGKEYDVYDDVNILNLDRYQKISAVAIRDLGPVDKSIEMMRCIIQQDISKEELELGDLDEMNKLLTNVNVDVYNTDINKEFEHDGVVYKLIGNSEKFTFNAGQINKISKAMQDDNTGYIPRMASVLYSDGVKSESEREVIFREFMTADYLLPFLKLLIDKYSE